MDMNQPGGTGGGGMGMGAGAPSSNDRLLAALGYPIFLVAIYVLVTEKKAVPFLKYHAVQALLFNALVFIVSTILGVTVVLALCAPLVWFATFWPAYKAYQGEYVVIPVLTDLMKRQGWA